MSEESVSDEVNNCVSEITFSALAAAANNDVRALILPKTTEAVDQTVYSILQESRQTPCDSLIRALNPRMRTESFRLFLGTKAIVSALPTNADSKASGFVPVLGAIARLSDEERRKGRTVEIEDITRKYKGLGGVIKLLQDGSSTLSVQQQATAIIAASSAPPSAIHSVLQGVAARDYFALAAGPIVAIFAVEMVLSRLRGRVPIGIMRPGR
jgi:hypothetical protein